MSTMGSTAAEPCWPSSARLHITAETLNQLITATSRASFSTESAQFQSLISPNDSCESTSAIMEAVHPIIRLQSWRILTMGAPRLQAGFPLLNAFELSGSFLPLDAALSTRKRNNLGRKAGTGAIGSPRLHQPHSFPGLVRRPQIGCAAIGGLHCVRCLVS